MGLPRGPTLGARVAALRRRRRLTQKQVAERAGVGRDVVINLEMRSVGRVDALQAVLKAMGIRLAFRENAARRFYNGLVMAEGRTTWRTPQWVLEKLYAIFGEFNLGPGISYTPEHAGPGALQAGRRWSVKAMGRHLLSEPAVWQSNRLVAVQGSGERLLLVGLRWWSDWCLHASAVPGGGRA